MVVMVEEEDEEEYEYTLREKETVPTMMEGMKRWSCIIIGSSSPVALCRYVEGKRSTHTQQCRPSSTCSLTFS